MKISCNKNEGVVIFDFDGVIINSHDVQAKALEAVYRKIGRVSEIPFEKFFRMSGDSLENIFTKLDLPLEMLKTYRECSSTNIGMIKVFDNIIRILQFIKNHKIPCALCTGKERSRTIEILKHFNLEQYFTIVICSDDVNEPKPDAESILTVMNKLRIQKNKCIMIGDGLNDIKCAHNAGVASIAVTWGDVDAKYLKQENPDQIAYTVDELYNQICGWINENV